MSTDLDMYELKREHRDYSNALNLLYMMYLASKSEKLNLERYSAALRLVWQHMCHIEERMSATIESVDESDDADAAENEA